MAIGNRDIEVYQIFEERTRALLKPRLLPVVIGVLKQKIRSEQVGVYNGNETTYPLPTTLKAGAVVEESSLKVLVDPVIRSKVELESSDFELTSQGVLINAGVDITFSILNDAGGTAKIYFDGVDYYLEDTRANFFVSNVYGDSSTGDVLTVLGLYGESYDVLETVSKTLLKIDVPNTTQLYADFSARPDRVFEGLTYDVDRNVTIGDPLLTTANVYVSFDAVRMDKAGQLNRITDYNESLTDLRPYSADNSVGAACWLLSRFADKEIAYITVPDESPASFDAALQYLEDKDCYYVIPLTLDKGVLDSYLAHVNDYSNPVNKKERRLYGSLPIPTQEPRLSGGLAELELTSGKYYLNDALGDYLGRGVQPGDIISLDYEDTLNDIKILTDVTVKAVISATRIEIQEVVRNRLVNGSNGFTEKAAAEFKTVTTLPATVTVGDSLEIFDGDNPGVYEITTITPGSPNLLELNGVSVGFFINNVNLSWEIFEPAAAVTSGVSYAINGPVMDADERSDYMRNLGLAYGDRRGTIIFPESLSWEQENLDDDGNYIREVVSAPSYLAAASIVGMRFATGPQKPSTGEVVRGFRGVVYSTDYTDAQLLNIQQGGILVLYPDEITGQPIIRQQLTTDVSELLKQEISVTESIDLFAKYIRANVRYLMGTRNLTDQTIRVVRMRINALIDASKEDQDGNGPLVGAATVLQSLERDPNCGDTLIAVIDVEPLIPFNKLIVRLYI